jgi:LacI family transcriptional regulator
MKQARSHPTLADVARIAGVGKATVSRVINGARIVSPETLQRVNTVIRELGYQPSQAARSLKGEGTKSIGLVLPSIADPFFADCAEAAQAVARSYGYLLIVAATQYDPQTEIDQLQSLIRHRVEGILLAPANSQSKALAAMIDRFNIPVVTLNHPLRRSYVQSVVCDNRGGARAATEHLIGHGYRRIICLGGDSRLYSIRERQKGYQDAIKAAGLKSLIEGSVNDYSAVEHVLRTNCHKRNKVDAIFAVRNLVTIFAFQAMQSLGIRIPEDVALVGFDDFDLACTLRPAVTVVKQPVEAVGTGAARLLFQHLQNTPARRVAVASRLPYLKTALILRNSCGCP